MDDTVPGLTDYPANGTIFDELNAHGITWKDYFSTTPSVLLYPPLYFQNLTKIVPIADFFADAAAGTLPGYCLVEPDYGNTSEENPQNIAEGEAFAAKVIDAVMTGPKWGSTLLVWTYDEHGGYPQAGRDEVESARAHLPGRQRGQPARPGRPGRPAPPVVRAAAGPGQALAGY